MSRDEWEALCDGCGHCCLVKLEDEETGGIYKTNISCRLLDLEHCRCRDYEHRLDKVEMCSLIEASNVLDYSWLPEHCAYRLLAEDKKLPSWHPLISGRADSVHEAGVSVKSFAQSEEFIHEQQIYDHIISKV